MKVFRPLLATIVFVCPIFGSTAFFIIQKDNRYEQTGPTTVNPQGFDFFASVNPDGGFDGGTVTIPGAVGTQPLVELGGLLQYGSGVVADGTNYPTGTYSFHVTDSTNTLSPTDQTVADPSDVFPAPIPMLTAASFTGLQTLDPTHAFVVNFNTFSGGSSPLEFLAILDLTHGGTPIFDGLQPGVTQDNIAANTLQQGTNYEYILFFTSNVVGTNTQLQLTSRTRGFFTTASTVPEPGTAVLCVVGIAAAFLKFRVRS